MLKATGRACCPTTSYYTLYGTLYISQEVSSLMPTASCITPPFPNTELHMNEEIN